MVITKVRQEIGSQFFVSIYYWLFCKIDNILYNQLYVNNSFPPLLMTRVKWSEIFLWNGEQAHFFKLIYFTVLVPVIQESHMLFWSMNIFWYELPKFLTGLGKNKLISQYRLSTNLITNKSPKDRSLSNGWHFLMGDEKLKWGIIPPNRGRLVTLD